MQHEPLSKRMQRGTIIMIVLLIVISFIPRLYYYFLPDEDFEIVLLAEDYDETFREQVTKKKTKWQKSGQKSNRYRAPKRSFDPNQYTVAQWMELGLSEKQAQSILNFNKYGFYSHRDIQKHFLFQDSLFFDLVKDSLIYPEKVKTDREEVEKKTPSIVYVDVNRANLEELKELPGVGEYTAKQILFYREQLGGFVKIDQLREVKGVREENFERMKGRLKIDLNAIQKIDVNNCTAKDLAKHPYISYNVANSIVKMKAKWEKYSNFEQLLESELIDQELLKKIQPYLTLSK